MAKWSELKAQGVKRCSAWFTNGKQCRCRAVTLGGFEGNWCAKHGPIMKRHTDFAIAAIKEAAVSGSVAEDDRDDDETLGRSDAEIEADPDGANDVQDHHY